MSNNIINYDALRDAGVRNWKRIALILLIGLATFLTWPTLSRRIAEVRTPKPPKTEVMQYVFTVLERNDTHRLLHCSAIFVADDISAPIVTTYGQIYLPYGALTDIPQRGETFRPVPTDTAGKYKPLMRSAPPTDAERSALVPRVVRSAAPTPAPTPPPKKR